MSNNFILANIAKWLSADTSGNLIGSVTTPSSDVSKKLATTDSLTSKIQPILASVIGNAMTVTLNPTVLDFRSATLTSGVVNSRVISSAISLTVPNTATLGSVNAVLNRYAIIAIDNAGTVELAIANSSGGILLNEEGVISTTLIAPGSSLSTVVYSATARTNVPYRVVGFVEVTQATAGTWATAPSFIQGVGGEAFSSLGSMGFGQTWQNVTGSRISGTTYYNTTGRPITVIISVLSGAGGGLSATINGLSFILMSGTGTTNMTGTMIVPVSASYSFASGGATIGSWTELR